MVPRKKMSTEKTTPRKRKPSTKKKDREDKNPQVDLNPPMSLYGELFWEYRAKMAEYEKALLELKHASNELKTEKSDPKYAKLLELMAKNELLHEQLRQHADLLRGVQVKVAEQLDLELGIFLKECVVDHETGVVKLID